ncbi:MAG: hypothetical protein EHM39_03595 [Chloroflexi bacterium]|nr:MAG: hypothetical protein EHM39_03595 [Chloroflexota bacterium]
MINQQAWIELQLTSGGPIVYVPSSCVQGLPSFGSIVWQGSRSESITFARENQTPQQQTQAQQEIDQFTGQPGQQPFEQFEWGHNFLVTLGCTTPVYIAPGGTAIETVQLAAGQSWFASPYLWFAQAGTTAPLTQQQPGQAAETQDQMQDQTTDQQGEVEPQPTPQY